MAWVMVVGLASCHSAPPPRCCCQVTKDQRSQAKQLTYATLYGMVGKRFWQGKEAACVVFLACAVLERSRAWRDGISPSLPHKQLRPMVPRFPGRAAHPLRMLCPRQGKGALAETLDCSEGEAGRLRDTFLQVGGCDSPLRKDSPEGLGPPFSLARFISQSC